MKVIVATDGSDAALEAASRSITLLRPGATIAVAMVIPRRYDPNEDAGGFQGPVMTEDQADAEYADARSDGKEALDRTLAVVGAEAQVLLISTDEAPADAIVRIAGEKEADLIVVGTEGPGFFSRLFKGSVSEAVVRNAPCPVLVVPQT